ncbi:hypothetical protein RFI_27761 [Reticulomyxa filosa]|uniref:Uncharacterized protein n=1 Tax=Reticulomyxa filosa TaxID=46433 RepID=X6M7I1_RETFI|nr:hypothetical protein RFI_27761 [Reticulomyxa filosa]|eukprot:ETO09621.1 hypothetical protein RFI_27761 [Reticulomyxa filosa]
MGNQNTNKSPEKETKHFPTLKELHISLKESQCVVCYSYHTLKNEYKFICKYPSDIILDGHCVVKLVGKDNKDINEITLFKKSLMMKYVSVWSNILNKSNKFNDYNQWTPFTDNHNNPTIIGKDYDYWGVRAVIGGSNNHLLFITVSCKENERIKHIL